jgi:hypothetical protein
MLLKRFPPLLIRNPRLKRLDCLGCCCTHISTLILQRLEELTVRRLLFQKDGSVDGRYFDCWIKLRKLSLELTENVGIIDLFDRCHVAVQQKMKHSLCNA